MDLFTLVSRRVMPRLTLAAAVLATGLLLLAGRPEPVSAAPTLSASENPVRFSFHAAFADRPLTKTIRISWNLDGTLPPLHLVVREQDPPSPPIQTTLVVSQTGSTPLTVSSGKTYLAELVRPIAPTEPLARLTIRTSIDRPPIDLFPAGRRQVEVVFELLDVLGDSDSSGSCECEFSFGVNAEPRQHLRGDYDSGMRGIRITKRFLLSDAPEVVALCVWGRDDDNDTFFPFQDIDASGLHEGPCLLAVGRIPGDTGSNSDADWNTARTALDVRSAGTRHFSMETPPGELRFAVQGRVTVSYVR